MLAEVIRRERDLSVLFKHAYLLDSDHAVDPLVKSGFVQFLCVRTYAYFELSLIDILKSYIDSAQSDPNVAQFAGNQLSRRRRRNLKHQHLLELIGYFNDQWRNKVLQSTSGQLQDSLDSEVNNRNLITHDELALVFVTLRDMNSYYQDIKKILDFVYKICV